MLGIVTPMDLEIIVFCRSFMTGDVEAASKWGVALVTRFKIVMGQNQHRGGWERYVQPFPRQNVGNPSYYKT
jgi:hypothetical protein